MKLLYKAEPRLLDSVDIYGNTPTHYASKYGNLETLKFLLKQNPKLFIKNKKNKNAMDVAYDDDVIQIFSNYMSKIRKNIKSIQKSKISANLETSEKRKFKNIQKSDRKSHDPGYSRRDTKPNNEKCLYQARRSTDDSHLTNQEVNHS